eukprot:gene8892-9629_t
MNTHTNSKPRGLRISQVVADARASLEEPSRPFTPQTMDERLDSTMKTISSSQIVRGSNQFQNMKSKVSMSTGNYRKQSPSPNLISTSLPNYPPPSTATSDIFQPESEDNSPAPRSHAFARSNSKENHQNSSKAASTSSSRSTERHSAAKKVLHDLCELLLNFECEYNGKKFIDESEFAMALEALKTLTDDFLKAIKDIEFSWNDVLELQAHFHEVIVQIAQLDIKVSLKTSFMAIVLKFCISSFHAKEISQYYNNITLKNIEMLVMNIYHFRITALNSPLLQSFQGAATNQSNQFRNSVDSSSQTKRNHRRNEEEEEDEEDEGAIEVIDEGEEENDDSSRGPLSNPFLSTNEETVTTTLLDTLIKSLDFIWNILYEFIKKEMSQIKTNYQQQKQQLQQRSSSSSSSTSTLQSQQQYERAIFHLFDQSLVLSHGFNIAAFLTAVIKTFTNSEVDRKRLIHAHLIDHLMKGFWIFEQSSYIHKIVSYPLIVKKKPGVNLSRSNSRRRSEEGDELLVRAGRSGSRSSSSRGGGREETRKQVTDDEDEIDIDELLNRATEDDEDYENKYYRKNQSNNNNEEKKNDSDVTSSISSLPIYPPEKTMNLSIDRILASLTQMIGIIRNFSLDQASRLSLLPSPQSVSSSNDSTVSSSLMKKLFVILNKYAYYSDIRLNIARVFAKLSHYQRFRDEMSSSLAHIEGLMNIVHKEAEQCRKIMNAAEDDVEWPQWYTWPLISRIAFTLGNLTTTNEENRAKLGIDFNGMPSILLLLQVSASSLSRIYQQKQQDRHEDTSSMNPYVSLSDEEDEYDKGKKENSDEEEEDDEYEIDQAAEVELRDATIKLIRLLANISIDGKVGMDVGSKYENLQTMLELLTICDQSLEQEEMLLNVVAALTNLTYYSCQYLNGPKTSSQGVGQPLTTAETKNCQRLEKCLIGLSTQLSNSLFHENSEVVLETLRVLGNLTRITRVIEVLLDQKIEKDFLILLQHTDSQILSAVIGIFINLSACSVGRKKLLETPHHRQSQLKGSKNEGEKDDDVYLSLIQQFTAILRKLRLDDMSIGTLISQALYNIYTSNEFKSLEKPVATQRMMRTLQELLEILDDDAADEKQVGSQNEGNPEFTQFKKVTTSILQILRQSSIITFL